MKTGTFPLGELLPGYMASCPTRRPERFRSDVEATHAFTKNPERAPEDLRLWVVSNLASAARRPASRFAGHNGHHLDEHELIHMAVCHALGRLDRFRGSSLRSWATKVASNALVSALRGWRPHVQDPEAEIDDLPGHDQDPSQQAMQNEELERLHAGIRQLPPNMRSTILLHLTGATTIEIARALHLTRRGVNWRLEHARQLLRSMLSA